MGFKTVKDVSIITGLSQTSIYKHIRKGRLEFRTVNGIKMITDESLELFIPKYATNQEGFSTGFKPPLKSDENNTSIHDYFKPVENPLIDEVKELKKLVSKLQSEKEELFERIILLERDQKEELKKVHNESNRQLASYMEFIKGQTDNMLEAQPRNNNQSYNESEVIHSYVEPTREKMKHKEFINLMTGKGYKGKEIKKIIKQQLKKKDARFDMKDNKVIIYRDKFKDL